MELKKLALWNWFKNEEEREQPPPRYRDTFPEPWRSSKATHSLLPDFDRHFNGLFQTFLGDKFWETTSLLKPHADLKAEGKAYILTVEIPGVEEDDVSIDIFANTLTIKGEKKQEKEEGKANYYRIERRYGSFQRILSLPQDVDQDNITATIKKGILTITIPKVEVGKAAHESIPITTG